MAILDVDLNSNRIKRANHANHIEEHSTQEDALRAIRNCFEEWDINIQERH